MGSRDTGRKRPTFLALVAIRPTLLGILVLGIPALAAVLALGAAPASANEQTCRTLARLRSINSDTSTTITFINDSREVRTVLWLDFTGTPKLFATLQPGQQANFNTFLTHPWMVRNASGRCLRILVPKPGGSTERLPDVTPASLPAVPPPGPPPGPPPSAQPRAEPPAAPGLGSEPVPNAAPDGVARQ